MDAIPLITIDQNLIIALEKGDPLAARLIKLHEMGHALICVPMISGSELQKNGRIPTSLRAFEERLARLSVKPFKPLLPAGSYDVCFYGGAIYASEEMIALQRSIHQVLFPQYTFGWIDHAKSLGLDPESAHRESPDEWRDWRNRLSDVLSMWCHIYYGCDHFVNHDRNYHKLSKKPKLIGLGAKSIVRLDELLMLLGKGHSDV